METRTEKSRYEIVLLEDNPVTLHMLCEKLGHHGIRVHGFDDGQKAFDYLTKSHHIGAFLTDIEIRYPFPNGHLNGLQGYDVANRISDQRSDQLLSVIVLTNLPQKRSLKLLNSFRCKYFTFSKVEWEELADAAEQEHIFFALAELVKEHAKKTPIWWVEQMKAQKPQSPWVAGSNPYWRIYRDLWMAGDCGKYELRIAKRAAEIVDQYIKGDHRPLQGGFLTLKETPDSISFLEHLVARRVVYAVRKIEPAYWESWLQGTEGQDEGRPEMDFWGQIASEELKATLNRINRLKVELWDLGKQRGHTKELVSGKRDRALQLLAELVTKTNTLTATESDVVQVRVAGIVRESQSLLHSSDAAGRSKRRSSPKPKPENRLQATLRLLGIEKKYIKDPDPNNWKLLLPEEMVWLKSIRG